MAAMTPISQAIDRRSLSEAKIALFRSLFRGRDDVLSTTIREPPDRSLRLWLRSSAARSIGASTPFQDAPERRSSARDARRCSSFLGAHVGPRNVSRAGDRRGWRGDRLTTRRPRVG